MRGKGVGGCLLLRCYVFWPVNGCFAQQNHLYQRFNIVFHHKHEKQSSQDSSVGSMLDWYLEESGVQISPSPIEFSIRERLRERFYAVRHKIRLSRFKFELMIWYIQSIHCRLVKAQKKMNSTIELHAKQQFTSQKT